MNTFDSPDEWTIFSFKRYLIFLHPAKYLSLGYKCMKRTVSRMKEAQ
ncbi:hypothetical protein [uncultured Proteiniphilum sp.]|nr:hypothetical protein [uncultured Proteiniphilum sp.]